MCSTWLPTVFGVIASSPGNRVSATRASRPSASRISRGVEAGWARRRAAPSVPRRPSAGVRPRLRVHAQGVPAAWAPARRRSSPRQHAVAPLRAGRPLVRAPASCGRRYCAVAHGTILTRFLSARRRRRACASGRGPENASLRRAGAGRDCRLHGPGSPLAERSESRRRAGTRKLHRQGLDDGEILRRGPGGALPGACLARRSSTATGDTPPTRPLRIAALPAVAAPPSRSGVRWPPRLTRLPSCGRAWRGEPRVCTGTV